jgi:hypothetical protein
MDCFALSGSHYLMLRPFGLALRDLMLRPFGLALRDLMLRPFGLALRALRSSHLAQILVDELHRYRPFTYARGHSFDRAMPYVPYGEYTRNVGFEQEGISF